MSGDQRPWLGGANGYSCREIPMHTDTFMFLIHCLRPSSLVVALALVCVLLASPSAGDEPEAMPDFGLTDVNASSSTYDQTVSPRDYLASISAWYFGHAT